MGSVGHQAECKCWASGHPERTELEKVGRGAQFWGDLVSVRIGDKLGMPGPVAVQDPTALGDPKETTRHLHVCV